MRTATLTLAILAMISLGLNSYATRPSGLSFEKPAGWFEADPSMRRANIKKFEFTRVQLDRLLANDRASGIVAVFHRDDPSRTSGMIPTIQVIIRPKSPGLPFEQFKKCVADAKAIGKMLEDFSIIGNVETPFVSGVRSVLVNGRFSLSHQSKTFKIRTRTYAIPRDDHFIQVSMSDEDDESWTEKEFAKFINAVKIYLN